MTISKLIATILFGIIVFLSAVVYLYNQDGRKR